LTPYLLAGRRSDPQTTARRQPQIKVESSHDIR
jgi:hypothetical protein